MDDITVVSNSLFTVRTRGILLNGCFGGFINDRILFEYDRDNSIGVELENCRNITVRNKSIKNSTEAGVFLQNSNANIIRAVHVSNNNTTYNDFGGIILQNSDGNQLLFNQVTGSSNTHAGYISADSYGGTYQCNYSNGSVYGMHFIGGCDNSVLKGNTFGINTIDLVVGNPNVTNAISDADIGVIGTQGDWDKKEGWGNKWTNLNNSTAHNSGTQTIIDMSAFLVKDDPDHPTGYLPKNIEAAGKWFWNKADKNLDPCGGGKGGYTPPLDCKDLIKKINKIDTLSEMGDCTKLMWEYKYYKELLKLKKKGLLSAECKEFLNKKMKNTVVQVVKIGNAIDSIEQIKVKIKYWGLDKKMKEKYSEGKDSKTKSSEDSIKIKTDSIRWVIDNTELVDSCLKVLNKVNKVRLNQIDNDTLSKSDIAMLLPIAESCPNEMGQGVYWARGLLSMYQNRNYDDFDNCMSVEISPRSVKSKSNKEQLQIFPNPAMDFVNIVVDLSNKKTGHIQIQDINGNIKYQKELHNSSLMIDINTGIYFVKYKSSTGEEMIKKLVIAR